MKKKKILCLFLSVLFSFAFAAQGYAAYLVNFTQGGVKYIYSNNPESIQSSMVSSPNYGQYTIDQPLTANIAYEAEFYHHNYTGQSLRMGIAVKNNNPTAQSIRVLNKAIITGQYTLETSTSVLRDYGNSTNDQYISIPANSSVYIMYSDVPTQYIVNGKVKFIPTANNMNARIFFILTNKSTSANQVFGLPRASSTNNSMTTGYFNYDTRYSNVNVQGAPSFYLSAYSANTNEYETGTNVIGNSKLLGNFGITYDIQLSNASGKRIKITPNLTSPGASQAQIVLWTQSTGWYRTSYLSTSSTDKYWIMNVPSDQHFKYILPGGNFGNVLFEIIN